MSGKSPIGSGTRLEAAADGLDEFFNGARRGPHRHTGFALVVFRFGEDLGRAELVTNGADRRDLVVLFKEIIARLELQSRVAEKA